MCCFVYITCHLIGQNDQTFLNTRTITSYSLTLSLPKRIFVYCYTSEAKIAKGVELDHAVPLE